MSTTFSKLSLSADKMKEVKTITFPVGETFHEINIKQYLPSATKIELIYDTFTKATNADTGYVDPIQLEVIGAFNIARYYTDIVFTDTQKTKNLFKTYDLMETNGLFDEIVKNIPQKEYSFIIDQIDLVSKSVGAYITSAAGVMKQIAKDQSLTQLNLEELMSTIQDPEQLDIIKGMMSMQQEHMIQKEAQDEAIAEAQRQKEKDKQG